MWLVDLKELTNLARMIEQQSLNLASCRQLFDSHWFCKFYQGSSRILEAAESFDVDAIRCRLSQNSEVIAGRG